MSWIRFILGLMVIVSVEGGCALSGKLSKDQDPVIVIGAGFSGLTAAYQLKCAGVPVQLFEAAERPGGRTQTVRFPNGALEELGAKEISDGGDAPSLRKIANELEVPILSRPRPYGVVTLNAQGERQDFFSMAQAFPKQLFQFDRPFQRLNEHLDWALGSDSNPRKLFETWIACYEGTNTQNLSYNQGIPILKRLQGRIELGSHPSKEGLRPSVFFQEGTTAFVDKLTDALKDVLVCNRMLISLERVADRLQLTFQDGHQMLASTVVLTLPIEILKALPMKGIALPEETFSAFQGGSNTKILIPVSKAHPENKGHFSLMPEFDSWWSSDLKILTVYRGGQHAQIPLETTEQKQAAFNDLWPTLCKLYPFLKGEAVTYQDCFFKNWKNHPHSRCSYSYIHGDYEAVAEKTVSYQGEDVLACFQPLHKQLFFAGEHTSLTVPGTMEGAVESGTRIARMIVNQQKE